MSRTRPRNRAGGDRGGRAGADGKPETLALALGGTAKKGDVIAAAEIAGVMAAKKTSDLIPLCHPLALSKVAVTVSPSTDGLGLSVTAEGKDDWQDRRGNGGSDRCLGRLSDDLRHAEGGR